MIKVKIYIIMFFLLATTIGVCGNVIEICIKNIKCNSKGVLRIAVFIDNESYRKEKPFTEHIISKLKLEKDHISLQIKLCSGKYGISVLDDENMDGEMNYTILRLPKEGFGFSNFKPKGLQIPCFNNFCFDVVKDDNLKIEVDMKYF